MQPGLHPILNLGEHGIVRDILPFELPENAWSAGRNVQFDAEGVESGPGYFSAATPSVLPYGLFPVTYNSTHYWVYLSDTGAYAFDGTTHYNITPTVPFTGSAGSVWSAALLNGNLVVTNGVDGLHSWDMNTSNIMVPLAGWPASAVAQDVVAFKQFLFGFNVELSGTSYPYRAKWSHQAAGGGLPTSWDETDPTLDAGERDLGDDSARLIGAKILGDTMLMFSNKQMHGVQYVGGENVFRFYNFTGTPGLLAKGGCATFSSPVGARAAYVSNGDVMITDGNSAQSMIDTKNRDWLFRNLDQDSYKKLRMVDDPSRKQLWLAFPETGESTLTKALMFDYQSPNLACGVRDLPTNTHALASGLDLSAGAALRWSDLATTAWSAMGDRAWGETPNDTLSDFLLLGTSGAVYKVSEDSNTNAGVPKESYVERTGLLFTERNNSAHVSGVRVSAQGGSFEVTVGSQDDPQAPVRWGTARIFSPGNGHRVDARSEGRFIALRLRSGSDVAWRVRSLALEYHETGDR